MEFYNIGKLVNTHGLKGEVRILSRFKHKDKIFKNGNLLYIGKDKKCFQIETYRKHKNFDMVVFKGYYDINLIEYLKGSFVYFNKEDLKLEKNTYLAIDLIGFDVIIEDKNVGVVSTVIESNASEILVLDNNNMIPYVDFFIKKVDIDNKYIEVNNVKGLIK